MGWRIPLFDPAIGAAEIDAVSQVLRDKWLTMGDRTIEFEARFAALTQTRHAVALNSCTAALHLAMVAAGIGPGDEVVCPSLTFVATANAIRYCGAKPVFADVESLDCWNLSRDSIEAVLTSRTRAVIVVHYAGYPCDMPSIVELAKEKGLFVVEDAAHAPGASIAGREVGAWGDVGCFSFFSNKNMTTGEGGMLSTDSDEIAERVRRLRSHGMTTLTLDRHKGHAFSYDVVDMGFNYRMSDLNAALGLVQLESLEERNIQRSKLVKRYMENLAGTDGLGIPFKEHDGRSAYHLMPVLLPEGADRRRIMTDLREEGIQTSIHYPPVDAFSAYVEADLGPCEYLRHTHEIGKRALTMPLYPSMGNERVDRVCKGLNKTIRSENKKLSNP